MQHAYDVATRTHVWTFDGAPALTYVAPAIESPDAMADPLLQRGIIAKIGDAAAKPRNKKNGASATDADKRAAMEKVVSNLRAGIFNERATAAVESVNVVALIDAIAAVLGKARAAVEAMVVATPFEKQLEWTKSDQFATAYAVAVAKLRPVTIVAKSEMDELNALPDA